VSNRHGGGVEEERHRTTLEQLIVTRASLYFEEF